MRHTRWRATFDEFEEELERVASHVGDTEGPPAPRWRVPADLGPLPEALAARATALLARLGEVRDLLERQRDHVSNDAEQLTIRRRASTAYRATDHLDAGL